MKIMKIKHFIGFLGLFGIIALAGVSSVRADDEIAPPTLPAGCAELQVPAGNEAAFHVYAVGVQIYRWNGAAWDFVAPAANLYANRNYRGKVGIHYGGPTWESNSGSTVVAARLKSCTPDATAIPWLLLQTAANDGAGIFANVTYVQRINTAGGLRPVAPGSTVGEEARVLYTAEYYFYRAED